MTRHELRKIFDRLDFYLKLDRKIQDNFEKFCKAVVSDCYTPIIARGSADGFIDGVCSSSQTAWLKEHLSYYAYELPGMEQATGEVEKTKYNLKKRSEYINFVIHSVSTKPRF